MAVCVVVIYTFLDWLLFIRFHVIDLDEQWIQLWIPFIIALGLSMIFIRPRLRILAKRKKGDFNTGFIIFASLAIAAPTIPAQMYLESSTGKLTSLQNVNELDSNATTEYYILKQHYAARNEAGAYYSTYVSGRYNADLNLDIYFATPIRDGEEAPAKTHPADESDNGSMVIVVDGVKTSKEELSKISPDSVESVNVLKGHAAAALYGTSVSSAMIITLKQHRDPQPGMMDDPGLKLPAPKAWLCVSYHKRISNHLSQSEKEEKFHAFSEESADDFNSRDLDSFTYLKLIPNSSDRRAYRKAVESLKTDIPEKDLVFLKPEITPFAERNGSTFPWIFGWLAISGSLLFLLLLIPKVDEEKLMAPTSVEPVAKTGSNPLIFLVPKKGYYITPLLINTNLIIFLAMGLTGSGFFSLDIQSLLNWGADYTPLTANGQWWRLLTSMFLHGGLMHLLANMYALLLVGILLEPMLGKNRYLVSYLATGITGSIVSTYMHKATVSVGASGAIFGLYGIFLALMLTNVFPKKVKGSLLTGVIIMITMTFVTGLGGGVDNAAHVGGLLSGIIIGLMLTPQLKREAEEKNEQVVVN
jgi:membrane associated rhomboid family serine protease